MNNKFRVIKIIDDTSLIVNAGIENDVSVLFKFDFVLRVCRISGV